MANNGDRRDLVQGCCHPSQLFGLSTQLVWPDTSPNSWMVTELRPPPTWLPHPDSRPLTHGSVYFLTFTSLLLAQVSSGGRLRRALLELLGFMPTGCPLTADTRHQSVGGGLPPQGRVTVASRPLGGGLKLSLYISSNRSLPEKTGSRPSSEQAV
jgi:hypothetical protein